MKIAKRRNKERRVSQIDAEGLLERDLWKTAIWIGTAVVCVTLIAIIEKNIL